MDLSVLAILRSRSGADVPEVLLHAGLPVTRRSSDQLRVTGDPVDAWLRSRPNRCATGLYLTRREAARELLLLAGEGGAPPRRILDPAVGAGVFLQEAWSLFGPDVDLHGFDIDPVAVALTRIALWRAGAATNPEDLVDRIRLRDALGTCANSCDGMFDLVCGNPPYGNAIESRTGRTDETRLEMRRRYPEIAVGPYDRSVLFVHLAARLLAPGGTYAMLVPRALLSARYAASLRRWLSRESPPRRLVLFTKRPAPECGIALVGLVGGSGPARPGVEVKGADDEASHVVGWNRLSEETWGALLDPEGGACEEGLDRHPRLGDLFEIRASMTVAEAYAIRDLLREGGEGWRFLTAGLIDRGGDTWGAKPARHLGKIFQRPTLPREVPGLSRGRAALFDRPKVIVAGLGRRLEARLDAKGEYAGSVGTLMVLARSDGNDGVDAEQSLARVAQLLNSDWISAIHRARRGPQALSGGSVPLGRRDLEALPFPASTPG
jgi:hypothetical protein